MKNYENAARNHFQIFTSDPSSLPTQYLIEVKERLATGKAFASDYKYAQEANKRLGDGKINLMRYNFKVGADEDFRSQQVSFNDVLDYAFKKTGVDREDFKVTKWGKTMYGKSIPVEYRAAGGAEVSIIMLTIQMAPMLLILDGRQGGKEINKTVAILY